MQVALSMSSYTQSVINMVSCSTPKYEFDIKDDWFAEKMHQCIVKKCELKFYFLHVRHVSQTKICEEHWFCKVGRIGHMFQLYLVEMFCENVVI